MKTIPAAEFHAQEIDIYLTRDGAFAMLALVGQAQTLSVTLPRQALERLQTRIANLLPASTPPSAQK